MSIKRVLCVVGLPWVLLLLLWVRSHWVEQRAVESRMACSGRMLTIVLALGCYQDVYGTLPPTVVYDADGHAMHSWRALVLPYCGDVGLTDLSKRYHWDEPWDGPNNQRLHNQMLEIFCCPSDHQACASGRTSYFVVVGNETLFPREGGVILSRSDRDRNTIMLVESNSLDVNWLEPRDIVYNEIDFSDPISWPTGFSSAHISGPGVATADGAVLRHEEIAPIGFARLLKRVKSTGQD